MAGPVDAPPPSVPTTTVAPSSRIDPDTITAERGSNGSWTATVDGTSYTVGANGAVTLADGSELYPDQNGDLYLAPADGSLSVLVASSDSGGAAAESGTPVDTRPASAFSSSGPVDTRPPMSRN